MDPVDDKPAGDSSTQGGSSMTGAMAGAWPTASAASNIGRVLVGAGGFFALGIVVALLSQEWAARDRHVVRGVRVLGHDVGGTQLGAPLHDKLQAIVDDTLAVPIALTIGGSEHATTRTATRKQLGLRMDEAALEAEVASFGRSALSQHDATDSAFAETSSNFLASLADRMSARRGNVNLVPAVHVDQVVARDFFVDLKDEIDRAAVDAHLDLDHHRIAPEHPGCLLKVYDALVAVEYLARVPLDTPSLHNGSTSLLLGTSAVTARVTADKLSQIDIGTVLGTWETRYSAVGPDTDRTYNLKVGADHLNGHILLPGEQFSFNETVGDRTEKEGYRVAPVISGGELIDGLAGGMCQIASTLHAAAFFGGLDIVSSTPHSRPSAYIAMGLDSTVVYPTTDLKLKNPYDFPIVMHYTVNQGTVKVELLGKARPNRVIFEREIRGETSFGTETRRDPTAPVGQRFPLQEGYPGYSLVRRRYVFAEDQTPKLRPNETVEQAMARTHMKALAKKEWPLHYPSTELIMASGSGPKTMKKRDPPPSHHIPTLTPEQRGLFHIIK